ncbi:acetyl-coenzyme A transporter 1-domain-containing protein [Chytriomyces sp. MP71]|nr:acetyl-coenzyme A transporter 1-domain-containing protein [Chytriomyces sp. MP71]
MGRKKMPKTTPNRRKTPSSQSSADAASTSSAVTPMAPLPSHAQSGVGKSAKPKSIADELPDFILLIVLYLLQGVPLGLIMGSVPFLLKAKLSFGDIALFSLSSYPYSLKLLWSPIVDSVYSKPIGRRKSWIVPIQAITGFFMLFLSTSIDDYVSPASTSPVPVTFLALTFAALVFLCATQDIAVDGWALTLLSEENKAYASTAQTIGLNSGYFLSFTVFLALNSTEFCEKYLGIKDGPLILLGQYLGFWGVMFLVCDLWLIIMKNEGPEAEEPAENEIQIVYKHIFQVISLPNMRQLIFMTMISKIGFMAHDSVSALKLLEKGFSKEDLALTVLIDFPIQIFVGYYVAKWSAGPRPLRPWLTAFHIRLAFSALGMLIVHSVPTPLGTGFFLFVIATSVLNSMVSTVMFVGVGSYYTQISDPRIGGTYMTLLNTVNNLAGTWPKYFVLRAVDYWTEAACVGVSEPFPCKSDVTRGQCVKAGGVCEVARDGYYPVGLACLAVGVVVLFAVVRPTVAALEKVPESAWRVSRDGEEGGEEMAQLISKRD